MSFDPQNPRGSASPPNPPPTTKSAANYIPPQPVNRGPSRALIAGGLAVAILLVGIVLLLVLNLFKSPAASPAPSASTPVASHAAATPAGSPNTSSVPSGVPPTIGSSLPPTTGPSIVAPSPGTPAAELLTNIPESVRATCATAAGSDAILVSATCSADGGAISVTYDQYGDATSMDAAYETVFAREQIDQGTGSCEDHSTWPAEGPYQVQNQPAGRRLCTDRPGSSTIYWTDDRLTILSTAATSTGDYAGLLQFWTNEAGPIQ